MIPFNPQQQQQQPQQPFMQHHQEPVKSRRRDPMKLPASSCFRLVSVSVYATGEFQAQYSMTVPAETPELAVTENRFFEAYLPLPNPGVIVPEVLSSMVVTDPITTAAGPMQTSQVQCVVETADSLTEYLENHGNIKKEGNAPKKMSTRGMMRDLINRHVKLFKRDGTTVEGVVLVEADGQLLLQVSNDAVAFVEVKTIQGIQFVGPEASGAANPIQHWQQIAHTSNSSSSSSSPSRDPSSAETDMETIPANVNILRFSFQCLMEPRIVTVSFGYRQPGRGWKPTYRLYMQAKEAQHSTSMSPSATGSADAAATTQGHANVCVGQLEVWSQFSLADIPASDSTIVEFRAEKYSQPSSKQSQSLIGLFRKSTQKTVAEVREATAAAAAKGAQTRAEPIATALYQQLVGSGNESQMICLARFPVEYVRCAIVSNHSGGKAVTMPLQTQFGYVMVRTDPISSCNLIGKQHQVLPAGSFAVFNGITDIESGSLDRFAVGCATTATVDRSAFVRHDELSVSIVEANYVSQPVRYEFSDESVHVFRCRHTARKYTIKNRSDIPLFVVISDNRGLTSVQFTPQAVAKLQMAVVYGTVILSGALLQAGSEETFFLRIDPLCKKSLTTHQTETDAPDQDRKGHVGCLVRDVVCTTTSGSQQVKVMQEIRDQLNRAGTVCEGPTKEELEERVERHLRLSQEHVKTKLQLEAATAKRTEWDSQCQTLRKKVNHALDELPENEEKVANLVAELSKAKSRLLEKQTAFRSLVRQLEDIETQLFAQPWIGKRTSVSCAVEDTDAFMLHDVRSDKEAVEIPKAMPLPVVPPSMPSTSCFPQVAFPGLNSRGFGAPQPAFGMASGPAPSSLLGQQPAGLQPSGIGSSIPSATFGTSIRSSSQSSGFNATSMPQPFAPASTVSFGAAPSSSFGSFGGSQGLNVAGMPRGGPLPTDSHPNGTSAELFGSPALSGPFSAPAANAKPAASSFAQFVQGESAGMNTAEMPQPQARMLAFPASPSQSQLGLFSSIPDASPFSSSPGIPSFPSQPPQQQQLNYSSGPLGMSPPTPNFGSQSGRPGGIQRPVPNEPIRLHSVMDDNLSPEERQVTQRQVNRP
jgi:hypothetical protein